MLGHVPFLRRSYLPVHCCYCRCALLVPGLFYQPKSVGCKFSCGLRSHSNQGLEKVVAAAAIPA